MTVVKGEKKIIPPDGGWGWMVVLGFALNNLVMVPLITGMGIIFKDLFSIFNISHTDSTIIMSTNMSFGMLMGLIHGPLLRIFGYRKIAVSGALIFSIGLILTAFAQKFTHFIISHGLLTSFGIGLGMAAFSLAVNTYFLEKRGRAMGMAMTFTGLGPIVMPQIISILLNSYTAQGTIIILGGIALHTVPAALLLQPIKWHAKRLINNTQDKTGSQECTVNDAKLVNANEENDQTQTITSQQNMAVANINKNGSISHSGSIHEILELSSIEVTEEDKPHKSWKSGKSMESVHLGSCLIIYDESVMYEKNQKDDYFFYDMTKKNNVLKKKNLSINDDAEMENRILKEEESKNSKHLCFYLNKFLRRVIIFFDLTLFCDPIYVNIMLGISIATFAEMNFSILTPFILKEMNFTTDQIATVMSVMAAIDLLMRGFSPFIGEWLHQTPRNLYLISLFILIISRSTLLFYTNYTAVIIMAVGVGFAKGFRSVFMSLVVPSHVPIERLPHAAGIQIFVNGFIIMILSPIMGVLRELKGNFVSCIILINLMTAVTIIMWWIEMCITNRINKKKKTREQYQTVTQYDSNT